MTAVNDLTTSEGCTQAVIQAMQMRKEGFELMSEAWEKLTGEQLTLERFIGMTPASNELSKMFDQMFLDYMESN